MNQRPISTLFFLSLSLALSCGDDDSRTTTITPAQPAPAPPPEADPVRDDGGVRSDGQIVSVMAIANSGKIEHGMLAQTKATNADVRRFATTAVTEHMAANNRLQSLASEQRIAIEPNPVSNAVKLEADAIANGLESLSGRAFDWAYMNSQVFIHEKVLALLGDTLIPTAANPALKADLATTRSSVAAHLERAQQIRNALRPDVDDAGSY